MGPWQELADALLDEDRLLRRLLAAVPTHLRLRRGPGGELSCQESLGHIAYWDACAVRHFREKIATGVVVPKSPETMERESREAITSAADRSWDEVLAGYVEATGALVGFISNHWQDLSEKERQGFQVPLRHRRHHRLALDRLLEALGGDGGRLAGQG